MKREREREKTRCVGIKWRALDLLILYKRVGMQHQSRWRKILIPFLFFFYVPAYFAFRTRE